MTLTGLTISDILTDGNGSALSLNTGPSYSSTTLGSNPGTLKVGEIQTYTAYYIISNSAGNTTSINNTAIVTASSPGQTNNVSDTSDDGNDTDGNTVDDSTVVPIYQNPVIEATKTVSITDNNGNGSTDLGDLLTYTITFENKGNVTLSGLTISDTLTDGNNQLLTLTTNPTFVSATTSSTSTTLQVSGVSTYTATYQVNQQAVDSCLLYTSPSPRD